MRGLLVTWPPARVLWVGLPFLYQTPAVSSPHPITSTAPRLTSSSGWTGPTGTAESVPSMGTTGYRDTFIWRLYDRMAQLTDQHIGWDRLPTALGLAVLVGLRNVLRRRNLHDTAGLESKDGAQPVPSAAGLLTERAPDGSHNDLAHPEMGMAGTRFGRNFPLDKVDREPDADLLSPNPRLVSRELMTRHEFIPATSINLLVAAWIQFMVKDWMSHGRGDREHSYTIPLAADDLWPKKVMAVLKTLTDPTRPPDSGRSRTFLNHQSPWWDASQVYGAMALPLS